MYYNMFIFLSGIIQLFIDIPHQFIVFSLKSDELWKILVLAYKVWICVQQLKLQIWWKLLNHSCMNVLGRCYGLVVMPSHQHQLWFLIVLINHIQNDFPLFGMLVKIGERKAGKQDGPSPNFTIKDASKK